MLFATNNNNKIESNQMQPKTGIAAEKHASDGASYYPVQNTVMNILSNKKKNIVLLEQQSLPNALIRLFLLLMLAAISIVFAVTIVTFVFVSSLTLTSVSIWQPHNALLLSSVCALF